MSNIRKLELEKVIGQLKEILKASTMVGADFVDRGKDDPIYIWITKPLSEAIISLEIEITR